MTSTPIADQMRDKLTRALRPTRLEIVDDSHRHRGHAGHDGRGESHFNVTIVAEAFAGKSRPERHRMVYDAVADELNDRVHALSLRLGTPSELG